MVDFKAARIILVLSALVLPFRTYQTTVRPYVNGLKATSTNEMTVAYASTKEGNIYYADNANELEKRNFKQVTSNGSNVVNTAFNYGELVKMNIERILTIPLDKELPIRTNDTCVAISSLERSLE